MFPLMPLFIAGITHWQGLSCNCGLLRIQEIGVRRKGIGFLKTITLISRALRRLVQETWLFKVSLLIACVPFHGIFY